jgi:hypothetical protein
MMASARNGNGNGNGLHAAESGRRSGAQPFVYEDRDDLPKGLVLYAYDGRLSVADRAGREHASLAFRSDRWVWRASGDAVFDGIAPNPADAWRVILEVLWSGQPTP